MAGFPLPPNPAPQPPPVPQTAPVRWKPGPRTGLVPAGVSATRPAPVGTKCSGPGPGSSRRPARLGPAVCKHKVNQGASERVSERVSELGSSTSRQPSPHPSPWGLLDRSPTCLARPLSAGSGPSARTGHGARSGRSPGPPSPAGTAPARRAAPRRSFQH